METIILESINEKMSPEASYTITDGLVWKDKQISDVVPYVLKRKILLTANGEKDMVEIAIVRGDTIIKKFDWDIYNISNIKWNDVYTPNPEYPRCSKYFKYIIDYMLENSKFEPVLYQQIDKVGWNKITITESDIYVFYTGERLILPKNTEPDIMERIHLTKSDWVLKVDEKYSEREAIDVIVKAISLHKKVGMPIVAFNIASLLKSILRECRIPPKFVPYVCGAKDRKKTAYILLLSPISSSTDNVSKLLIQLNSTSHTVESLTNQYPEFPLILDNVYESEDSKTNRHIRTVFEGAIQIIGDDIGKDKAGKHYHPVSSIIATGEKDGWGNASTVARYLTIPFEDEIKGSDKESLMQELQNEPMAISTFYYYFLQWVVDNVESIKIGTIDLLTDFREIGGNLKMSPKLKERYFILRISYMLFLEYCKSIQILNNSQAINSLKSFSKYVLEICYRHNKTIVAKDEREATKEESTTIDYLELLKQLYSRGELDISSTPNEFGNYWCAISYDRHLCLRTEPLMKVIKKYVSNAKLDEVIQQLKSKDMLKVESGKDGKNTPKACAESHRCLNIKPEYTDYILDIK